MNEFYQGLYGQISRFGYQKSSYHNIIFWQKRQQDCILLLRIIPEQLPGQNPVDLDKEYDLLDEAARSLMIMSGQKVETFALAVRCDRPDDRLLAQVASYDNIWCIDRLAKRIYIYEHQKNDFYGLVACLDEFFALWEDYQNHQRKVRMQDTFTPVNTFIIGINVLIFGIMTLLGNTESGEFIARHGGMAYELIVGLGEYWRLFTAMFLHFGLRHLAENMLMLIMTGRILERYMGKVRYMIIYFGAGLASSVCSLMFTLAAEPYSVSAGASGAICGVLGGLFFVILENLLTKKRRSLEGISLRGISIIIFFGVGYGFMVSGVDNAAHLGGLAAGFVITAILQLIRK